MKFSTEGSSVLINEKKAVYMQFAGFEALDNYLKCVSFNLFFPFFYKRRRRTRRDDMIYPPLLFWSLQEKEKILKKNQKKCTFYLDFYMICTLECFVFAELPS